MEQTQPQVTLTIEDSPSDGTMKFLKDWTDLIHSRSPTPPPTQTRPR